MWACGDISKQCGYSIDIIQGKTLENNNTITIVPMAWVWTWKIVIVACRFLLKFLMRCLPVQDISYILSPNSDENISHTIASLEVAMSCLSTWTKMTGD